ncbi:gamma-aminobutyric acid type B receptor subunit 2-like isoform X2 [Pomacea canaliculata]|uniref:gamma-aminobutyric acid type B receptor subunit 2-like isoform X2 n=1 Tax=Pomacea canaliculata TaxID=400727 RepID=UPI000D72EB69|nr:gamma-aminobutyric acid type B receptor subunit 2-like isoform X2 [Pomacea canaliculata]
MLIGRKDAAQAVRNNLEQIRTTQQTSQVGKITSNSTQIHGQNKTTESWSPPPIDEKGNHSHLIFNFISDQSKDARIIYVASFENKARQAVCAAYRRNFYGPQRVWIFPASYGSKWYEINDTKCTASQMLQVIDGYFTIAPSHYHGNDTVSKMSISDVYCRYKTLRNQSCDPHYKDNSVDDLQGLHYMPLAYDAMWAVALALHKTLTDLKASGSGGLENFTYNNTKLAEKIYENMQNVSFKGISGDIAFSPKGERVATVSVFQFQQNSGGQFVAIGRQKRSDMEIEWNNTRVYWPKGKPVSVRPTKKRLIPLPKEKYIVMCSLAALGMLTSAIFLTFNIAYRNVRMIKMSSPMINNLIVIGCLFSYSSIFIEDVFLSGLSVYCYAKLYVTILGFYTAFGALFSKTWRVYKIMSDLSFNGQDLQDRHLFLRVAVLVIFNLLLLVVWTSVDPFIVERQTEGQPELNKEEDYIEISESLRCRLKYSQSLDLVLLSTQGLLIFFGAFLAWQTRKVSIPELNDSRWVGMCIYNVVLLGSLRAILVMGTHQTPEMTYLTDSVIAFIGASVTQYFIFVPKMMAFRRQRQAGPDVLLSRLVMKNMCLAPSGSTRSPTSQHVTVVTSLKSSPVNTMSEVEDCRICRSRKSDSNC